MASAVLRKRAVSPSQKFVAKPCRENVWMKFEHPGGYATLVEECEEGSKVPNPRFELSMPKNVGSSAEESNCSVSRQQPYGVLYRITEKEFRMLDEREVGYRWKYMAVCVEGDKMLMQPEVDSDESIVPDMDLKARVFVSRDMLLLRAPVCPTHRYKNLLLEGALENRLPEAHISWLREVPAVDSSALSRKEYGNNSARALANAFALLIGVVLFLPFIL